MIEFRSNRRTVIAGCCAMALVGGATLLLGRGPRLLEFREVEPEPAFYLARKGEAWRERSRVVGVIRYPPAQFTIAVHRPGAPEDATPLREETHSGALTVYETGWLPVGRYDLVIQAEGFVDQRIANVLLKPATDCVINLFFNPKIYRRR